MAIAKLRFDFEAPPAITSLRELAQAEHECRRCPLYQNATQAVPGEGRRQAHLMLVGEQPGDKEDLQGHPFVGPAGRVLDEGLERAGVSPQDAYITNVVKHFRYKARGKRRIHQTPKKRSIYFVDPSPEVVRTYPGDGVPPTGVGEPPTAVVAPALAPYARVVVSRDWDVPASMKRLTPVPAETATDNGEVNVSLS